MRLKRTLVVMTVALATALPAVPAHAGSGCVTHSEFRQITGGMGMSAVHRIFDTRGHFYTRDHGQTFRWYDVCGGNQDGVATVGYKHRHVRSWDWRGGFGEKRYYTTAARRR